MSVSLRLMWLVVLVLACACGPAAEPPVPLVVASDFSNPPFASWDGESPVGFEPDLAQRLAGELQRPLVFKKLPFADLLPELARGECDVVIATTGITTERARSVAFSRPYYRTEISVVARVGADEPRSLDDLTGRRVGASRGTTSEPALKSSLPGAVAVLERKNDHSWGQMLAERSIDAACMDGPDAQRLVEANPTTLRRLGALTGEDYAIAVGLGADTLLARVDKILEKLERDGELARLAREYDLPQSL